MVVEFVWSKTSVATEVAVVEVAPDPLQAAVVLVLVVAPGN